MNEPMPRIRIVIDEVRMRGIPSRDARRLLDMVERELARLGPDIARAASLPREDANAAFVKVPTIPAPRKIETAGSSIAHAIVKAIEP